MSETIRRGWEDRYRTVSRRNPLRGTRALLAYNSVIDKVRILDEAILGRLRPPEEVPPLFAKTVEDLDDLAEGLCHSISHGLALEVLCGPRAIRFLEGVGGYEARPGGQVVTVGRLLSDFDAARILVHPDRFHWEVASLYQGTRAEVPLALNGVAYVPAVELHWDCEPEVHYILEYEEGTSFGAGPAPRANRFIAAPRTSVQFHQEWERALPTAARQADVFFVAGLNHMGEAFQESFRRVREHIGIARAANPDLVVHLEITSMPDLRKREAVLEDVLPAVDSVGVNETELADLAFQLGHPSWEAVRRDPLQQVEALRLLRSLGPRRANLHTLGYYLTLSPRPLERVRESLLFAALVGAARARRGEGPAPADLPEVLEVPLAERGLEALDRLAEGLGLPRAGAAALRREGWAPDEELVAVPTRLVPRPRHTVGLGDVISGASVFGEVGLGTRRETPQG